MWTLAVRDRETGEARLVNADEMATMENFDRFERHVVPCVEEGGWIKIGYHTLDRHCICRPELMDDGYDDVIVVHEERKPN